MRRITAWLWTIKSRKAKINLSLRKTCMTTSQKQRIWHSGSGSIPTHSSSTKRIATSESTRRHTDASTSFTASVTISLSTLTSAKKRMFGCSQFVELKALARVCSPADFSWRQAIERKACWSHYWTSMSKSFTSSMLCAIAPAILLKSSSAHGGLSCESCLQSTLTDYTRAENTRSTRRFSQATSMTR